MADSRGGNSWSTVAQLIQHPLRQRLLFKYAEAVTSPSAVATALGVRLNLVSYHTKVLLRANCLELVRTERRRGAQEHFYRAILGSVIDDDGWKRLPVKLRRRLVRLTLDTSWQEAKDALPIGGMDDAEAHMSRSPLMLDAEARKELSDLLVDVVHRAAELETASQARDEGSIQPWQLVIFGFQRASRP